MSYRVVPLESFKKDFKSLQKRYKNIKQDIKKLTKELQDNPKAGVHLTQNCYKIRVANSSIPTGKSGGFRTIYYHISNLEDIYLISIYSKTQKESISQDVLIELLKTNGLIE